MIKLAQAGKLDEAVALLVKELAITREVRGELHEDAVDSLQILARLQEARRGLGGGQEGPHGSARHPRAAAGPEGLADRRRPPGSGRSRPAGGTQPRRASAAPGSGSTEPARWTALSQGKYAEGIDPCRKAMEIRGELLGENHPDYAASLSDLAALYYGDG